MPTNPEEVYAHLVDTSVDAPDVPGLLAYGLFARDLYRWREHRARISGQPVTAEMVDQHIANDLAAHYFDELRDKSTQVFGAASLSALSDYIEEEKSRAVSTSILNEVKKSSGFFRQFFFAIVTAILAPLIIGGVIAAYLAYSKYNSPSGINFRGESPPAHAQPDNPPPK